MPEVSEHFMSDPCVIVRFLKVPCWNLPQAGSPTATPTERESLNKPAFGLQVAPAAVHHQVSNGSPYDAGLH